MTDMCPSHINFCGLECLLSSLGDDRCNFHLTKTSNGTKYDLKGSVAFLVTFPNIGSNEIVQNSRAI